MTMKIFRFLIPEDSSTLKKGIFLCLVFLTGYTIVSGIEEAYWKYWPFNPATIHSIRVMNPGKEVCAGDEMVYVVEITKHMDVPCKVKRALVNSSLIPYPVTEPPRKPLGYQKVSASIHVPRSADYREYYMPFTIDYEIGPKGRIISRSMNSEKFIVKDCSPLPRQGKQGIPGKDFWGNRK
jgi:hypothetical protein